jgi:hypothetical protein
MSYETVLRNIDRLGGRHDGNHWDYHSHCSRCDAHETAAHAFARLNGWKLKGRHQPNLDHIGLSVYARPAFDWDNRDRDHDLLDHQLWFTAARRYVAAVGQPYDLDDDEIEEWRADLAGRGLVLHVPPDPLASIHYPGATAFLVVTRPGVTVHWLPEQHGRLARSWKARLRKADRKVESA